MEKISKDESFEDSFVANPATVETNNDLNRENANGSTNQQRKIKFEKDPLNFIYPQFIVIFLSFIRNFDFSMKNI